MKLDRRISGGKKVYIRKRASGHGRMVCDWGGYGPCFVHDKDHCEVSDGSQSCHCQLLHHRNKCTVNLDIGTSDVIYVKF